MKDYLKYVISLVIAIIAGFLADFLIIQLSKSPNGSNTEFGFIEVGIILIIGLIVGCTSLILFTINNSKRN